MSKRELPSEMRGHRDRSESDFTPKGMVAADWSRPNGEIDTCRSTGSPWTQTMNDGQDEGGGRKLHIPNDPDGVVNLAGKRPRFTINLTRYHADGRS